MNKTHWLTLSENRQHPYQLVASSRAKYVRVKLSNKGELSVILPCGIAASKAHEFLKSRTHWVNKHLQNLPVVKEKKRPEVLRLELLNEMWQLSYLDNSEDVNQRHNSNIQLQESGINQLTLSGNTSNLDLIEKVILMWCKQQARTVFSEMLSQIAEEFGFHYNRLSIRAQKTRWGSCSSNKNISLNCKLLFMPEEVVRYVMIHELCHTLEMNHSHKFWALVKDCDPNYKAHQRQLKKLSKETPL